MLSVTNFWMGFLGLIYLAAGVFVLRKDLAAARGWNKLIALGGVFIAASLAAFAPEHFHGPEFVQQMVPSWMPARLFWPHFVGCALLAAASTSLTREEVCTVVLLPSRIDVLSVCLHALCAVCSRASQPTIRVGIRAERSLFLRRGMGSRRTA